MGAEDAFPSSEVESDVAMMRIVKWAAVVFAVLAGLIVLAIALVFITSQRMLDRTYPKRPTAVHAASTPEALAQGAHLVVVATCTDCHGKDLTGTLLPVPGSTVYAPNLTVITNSVSVVEQLSEAHGIETICLGGRLNPRFKAFFGFVCEQAISSLRANTLFMSASTVFSGAAYHQQEDVVKTKRALMGVADNRVLLVDSSKFGVTALIRLAALSDFDVVLTDSGIGATEAEALRQSGVNLRVVEV